MYKDFFTRRYPLIIFIGSLFLLGLLLLKNPFSERNLISNLEPYPDTLHYINPAINFLEGKGMYLQREDRKINPRVPPLYSVSLLPILLINREDPRVFYFINIALSLGALFLFYLFLKKISKNPFILGFGLFLYVSNYFIYWFPNLAMAETLFLFLFNLSLFLLTSKVSAKTLIIFAFVTVGFYATKYASIPLVFISAFLYSLKIWFEIKKRSLKVKTYGIFFGSLFIFVGLLSLYEYLIKGVNLFANLLRLLALIIPNHQLNESAIQTSSTARNAWFSLAYFKDNLTAYWGALNGSSMRFLWDFTPIVPAFVGKLGLLGLILGMFKKDYRFISLALLLFIFSVVFFISTFYSVDARYIYHVIPSLTAGFGLFFVILFTLVKKHKIRYLIYLVFSIVAIFYFATNIIRLKNQIVLNLKYSETPWNYISVRNLNDFFNNQKDFGKKPFVISAAPPYYIDFFSNGKYSLLPLSINQEFYLDKEKVWGQYNYPSLVSLYEQKIKAGYPLYLSRYGIGNEGYLHVSYNDIFKNFKVTEVQKGCFEVCNLYQVELKE